MFRALLLLGGLVAGCEPGDSSGGGLPPPPTTTGATGATTATTSTGTGATSTPDPDGIPYACARVHTVAADADLVVDVVVDGVLEPYVVGRASVMTLDAATVTSRCATGGIFTASETGDATPNVVFDTDEWGPAVIPASTLVDGTAVYLMLDVPRSFDAIVLPSSASAVTTVEIDGSEAVDPW